MHAVMLNRTDKEADISFIYLQLCDISQSQKIGSESSFGAEFRMANQRSWELTTCQQQRV